MLQHQINSATGKTSYDNPFLTANQRRKVQLQALQTAMMMEMKAPTRMMIIQVEVMQLLLSQKFSKIHLMSCQSLQ